MQQYFVLLEVILPKIHANIYKRIIRYACMEKNPILIRMEVPVGLKEAIIFLSHNCGYPSINEYVQVVLNREFLAVYRRGKAKLLNSNKRFRGGKDLLLVRVSESQMRELKAAAKQLKIPTVTALVRIILRDHVALLRKMEREMHGGYIWSYCEGERERNAIKTIPKALLRSEEGKNE